MVEHSHKQEHHVTSLFYSGFRGANGGHIGAECALKYCAVVQGSLCALLKLHFWGAARCSKDALMLLEIGYNAAIIKWRGVWDTKTDKGNFSNIW